MKKLIEMSQLVTDFVDVKTLKLLFNQNSYDPKAYLLLEGIVTGKYKDDAAAANDLYKSMGIYSYSNGFNSNAIIALLIGILPNVPGFLLQIKLISATAFPQWISHLYNYAWFVGFLVSGVLYLALMKNYKPATIINTEMIEHVSIN